jgi:hypothetical protein
LLNCAFRLSGCSFAVNGRMQPLPDDQPTPKRRAGDQVEGTVGNFSILQT